MTNHLTEDQISRWFAGQSSASEQRHVQSCGTCTAELGQFLDTLESFKSAVSTRAEKLTHQATPSLNMVLSGQAITSAPDPAALQQLIQTPSLLVSLKRVIIDVVKPAKVKTSAAPVQVKELWSKDDFRHTRWLSLVVHAVVIGLLVIPPAITGTLPSTETVVSLYNRSVPLILNFPRMDQAKSSGGGGGGRKALTAPSQGVPPRGADRQIVPPLVEVKNFAPELVVESTVIAPDLQNLRPLNLQIGDPNGVVGPLSAGRGTGGGIGIGDGTGVGPGKGPGVGPGEGGNTGDGIYQVGAGGGVTPPVVVTQIQPEYSDDARKARVQGTVEMVIIVQTDGTAKLERVVHSLGYGLDQRAIEAVIRWKFLPGKKDGLPVPTRIGVAVNFSLR
jgi:TonB family protein